MSAERTTIRAQEVQVGDHLFSPSGHELTVTRIDSEFMGRPDLLAFVEDSDSQWLKLPLPTDAEVEVVRG
jgi:hypothetical protein